ncbi:MAG: hypothetical protein J6C96_07000 [Oscillospiraceae bacterium]|nr:hypothetical protein [Oscillospiraceae bacterium]
MIDSYDESKWDKFELSGKISDYLEYMGIPTKYFSNIKGEHADAGNGNGLGDSGAKYG